MWQLGLMGAGLDLATLQALQAQQAMAQHQAILAMQAQQQALGAMGAMPGAVAGVPGLDAAAAVAAQTQLALEMDPAAKRQRVGDFVNVAMAEQLGQQLVVQLPPPEGIFRGEIRFLSAESVPQALALHGSDIKGTTISVEVDAKSKDGTKIIITGLKAEHGWQDIKDHFSSCGQVVFASIKQGGPCVGQVRFQTSDQAQQGLLLNGSMLHGQQIEVKIHAGSKDGTKLQITNLPPGLAWQDLKDHFAQSGLKPIFVDTSADEMPGTGEVRYHDATHAAAAVQLLNGSVLAGGFLQIEAAEGATLKIIGVPPGIEWQELKDHFNQVGQVAFCEVTKGPKIPRPAKGAGKGGNTFSAGCGMGEGGCGGGDMGGCGGGDMAGCGGGMGGKGTGKLLPNGLMISPNGVIVKADPSMMAQMPMMGGGCGGGCGGCGGKGAGMMNAGMMNVGVGGCGGAGCGAGGGDGTTGEVRFQTKVHAELAVTLLNGSNLAGAEINVVLDTLSVDGTKLIVTGLAPGTNWKQMKEHFAEIGQVAFAQVK